MNFIKCEIPNASDYLEPPQNFLQPQSADLQGYEIQTAIYVQTPLHHNITYSVKKAKWILAALYQAEKFCFLIFGPKT